MSWLIRYLLLAATAATAVWYGVPILKRQHSGAQTGQTHIVFAPPKPQTTPASTQRQAPNRPKIKPHRKHPSHTRTNQPPTHAGTNQTKPSAPTYPRPRIAQPEEGASWAILRSDASCYTEDGKCIGAIKSGTILDCLDYREVNGKQTILCQTDSKNIEQKLGTPKFLVRLPHLVMMTSRPEALTDDERDNLRKYYRLIALMHDRRRELDKAQNPDNPHRKEYAQANEKLKDLERQNADLLERRDTASGSDKSLIEDQLHELKYTKSAAETKPLAIQEKFRKWQKEHPRHPVVLAGDPQYAKYQELLPKLAENLGGMRLPDDGLSEKQ
ncbi:MAG: hypothetical protein ACI4X9_06125 [Kiritimatiellia bacterium]